MNLYLMLKLSPATWVRFGVWMAAGMSIYLCYGCKESSEEYRRRGLRPPSQQDGAEDGDDARMVANGR